MKHLLAACLILGLAACAPSHGTPPAIAPKTLIAAQLPVKSYQDALQIVLARPEMQKIIEDETGDGWTVKFEDYGYDEKGSDCARPDSWNILVIHDGPERAPCMMSLYVERLTGCVFVDGGLEPPVPLKNYEAWLNTP